MKIVSWNVNGIRSCDKKGFRDFFKQIAADIFCVQETRATVDQVDPELTQLFGTQSYWSSAKKKGYSGTATYFKNSADEMRRSIGVKKFDSEGRFVITRHQNVDIYNVYFPNGGASEERHLFKQEFLVHLTKHLIKQIQQGRAIILLGDYNVAYQEIDVYDPVGLKEASGFLPEERKWFQDFLTKGFVDVFRHFYPHAKDRYSWWSYKERARIGNRGWRIDHICVSQNLIGKVISMDMKDEIMGSDHCPLVMEIDI